MSTYANIIDQLGAPTRTTPDGQGGTILIYEDVSTSSNGYVTRFGNAYLQSNNDVQYLHLYINKDNYCYKTKSRIKNSELSVGSTVAAVLLGVLLFVGIGASA